MEIHGPLLNQASICLPILRLLPDWFGIEAALQGYEREIDGLPTFLAESNGQCTGFLSFKQHTPCSAEVYLMGVHPLFHRCGIGTALVLAAEAYARSLEVEYLQVKTLGPSRPDEAYARTRAFYEKAGFRPLEEFPHLWNEDNPCLVMVKKL